MRQNSATQKSKLQRTLHEHAPVATAPHPDTKTRPRENADRSPGLPPAAASANFTFHVNPTLTLVCLPPDASAVFPLDLAADLTGVHPEMLRYYCRLGLLGADRTDLAHEPTFDEEALLEVRRIEHYRRHLAVSRRALPLICELRLAAERQQIEIHFLRLP